MSPTVGAVRVLVVEVAGLRFGMAISTIEEVLAAVLVTPLPGAPAVVDGVIDLRGELVPVIAARRRLGLEDVGVRLSERFVITSAGDRIAALRVDAALDVVDVDAIELADVLAVAPNALTACGVARMRDGLLVIHDPSRFLSVEESAALGAAIATFDRTIS